METENYNKRYYEAHKEAYKTKYLKKIVCECCEKEMLESNYKKHRRTSRYQLMLSKKNGTYLTPDTIEAIQKLLDLNRMNQ